MEKKKFYITTPIYYPSDKLHIGHTYCTVATDTLARYHRLRGEDVMFLTGTDEHGQKIETKAKEAGVTPKEFVDNIVEGPRGVKDLWKLMNISNDRFIRTTDDYHVESVQKIFKKMYEKGDIYKGTYKGKYCTPCESFWTESQLVDGKCPDCGRPVQDAEEEAYFFRLSKYADRIRDDELAASAMGINVFKYKVMVFVIASMLAGLAGAFYAQYTGYIDPTNFSSVKSNEMLLMVIFGGLGSAFGSFIGAIVLTVIPELLRGLSIYRQLIYGVLLVALMLVRPQGLFGSVNFKYLAQRMGLSKKDGKKK